MRTRLELGTSGSIDLTDDIAYSLNFAIADIREPDKRNASFSKTIKVPGSKQNNKLFAHIFEIDINCNFNPNLKTPCTFYIDEIRQLKGYLQLLKVYYNDELKLEYEVTIKGSIGNIFTVIADQELTALDMSAFNHTYNQANIVTSWSATVGSGYVYPLLDYGLNNMIDYKIEHFFPSIYVKTYIDKIFALAGYTYSSAFFNSDLFKRLVIPFNGTAIKLSEATIQARLFDVSLTTPYTALAFSLNTYANRLQYNTEALDPANAYNNGTYVWTCPARGYYKFEASVESKASFANVQLNLNIMLWNGVSTYTQIGTAVTALATTFKTIYANAPSTLLEAGQRVVVVPVAYAPANYTVYFESGRFLNAVSNTGVVEGDVMELNNSIPTKIKIKDFLKSIINMFNLYLDTDKDNELQMNIEPRNDFYNNGTTIDWTTKLDVSKEFMQEPMGALDAKKFIFTYSEDKDYYNGIYKENYNEVYGTQRYEIENDFLTATKETKLIFSPTPLTDGSQTDRVISCMIPKELTTVLPKGNNIRILYYGGLASSDYLFNIVSITGTTSSDFYPYAGHLDSTANPGIDLNYGVPREIYYSTTLYTNNNLFNVYHRKFIQEITDKDSKILTGYFYLTPKDIYLLDFRNQFFVDGHLLRLNKIYDYNPLKNEVTKCEFIKIKSANAFAPLTQTSNGGNNITIP